LFVLFISPTFFLSVSIQKNVFLKTKACFFSACSVVLYKTDEKEKKQPKRKKKNEQEKQEKQ
jgi:hypothetical protein